MRPKSNLDTILPGGISFNSIDCYLVKTLCYSCLNQYGPPPVTNTIYLSYKSFRSCVPTLYWGQWESTPDNPASKIQ